MTFSSKWAVSFMLTVLVFSVHLLKAQSCEFPCTDNDDRTYQCIIEGPERVCLGSTSSYTFACTVANPDCPPVVRFVGVTQDGNGFLSPFCFSPDFTIDDQGRYVMSVDWDYRLERLPGHPEFPNAGESYEVYVTGASTRDVEGMAKKITVYPANVPIELPSQLCSGQDFFIPNTVIGDVGFSASYTFSGASTQATSEVSDLGAIINIEGEGVVTVCRTLESNGGFVCEETTCEMVEIINTPILNFSPLGFDVINEEITICEGQEVYFRNSTETEGGNLPMNYSWFVNDFQPGATSFGDDLLYEFRTPGTYMISLSASLDPDFCEIATTYLTVQVSSGEGVEIICPTIVCGGSQVLYEVDDSCESPTWEMSEDIGQIISTRNNGIIVLWNEMSEESLGFVSVQASGCNESSCDAKSVTYVPIIPITTNIVGDDIVCNETSASYSLPAFPGATYNWTVSELNGEQGTTISSSFNQASLTFPNAGNGNVKIAVSVVHPIAGCTLEAELNVGFRSFSVSGTSIACGEADIFLNVMPELSVNEDILFEVRSLVSGELIFSTDELFIPAYTLPPGRYEGTLLKTSGGLDCSANYEFEVVDDLGNPSIVGPTIVCPGEEYFYGVSFRNNSLLYEWTVTEDGVTRDVDGSSFGANIIFGIASVYSVGFTTSPRVAGRYENCTFPDQSLAISPVESFIPTIEGNQQVCPDGTSTYSVNEELYSYEWLVVDREDMDVLAPIGSVVSGQSTSSIDVQWFQTNEAVEVSVLLKYQICPNDEISQISLNVIVSPLEVTIVSPSEICQGGTAILQALPEDITNVTWEVNGSLYTGNPSPPIRFSAAGPQLIQLTAMGPNGCSGEFRFIEEINVIETPQVGISPSDVLVAGGTINLIASPADAESYEWFIGSSNTPIVNSNTNVLQISSPGSYSVVATFGECSSTASIIITEANNNGSCDCEVPFDLAISNFVLSDCFNLFVESDLGEDNMDVFIENNTLWRIRGPNYNSSLSINSIQRLSLVDVELTTPGRYFIFLEATPNCENPCRESVFVTVDVPFKPEIGGVFTCSDTGSDMFDLVISDRSTYFNNPDVILGWLVTTQEGTQSFSTTPPSLLVEGGQAVRVDLFLSSSSGKIECDASQLFTAPPATSESYTYDVVSECTGEVFTFIPPVLPSQIESISWDFGDGSSSNLASPDKVFTESGEYIVGMILNSTTGCTYSSTQLIKVNVSGTLSGSIGVKLMGCNASATLIFSPSIATEAPSGYIWSTGEETPVIIVQESGAYSLTVINENGCRTMVDQQIVSLEAPVMPIIDNPDQICQGEPALFQVTASVTSEYTYRTIIRSDNPGFPDVELDGARFFILDPTSPAGTYTMSVQAFQKDVLCASTESTLVVTPTPDMPEIIQSVECEPYAVVLSTQYPSVNWSLNGMSPMTTTEEFSPLVSGTYIAYIESEDGCSSQSEITIQVGNINLFLSGCYRYCQDSIDSGLELPGIPGIYEEWTWIVRKEDGSLTEIQSGTGEIEPLLILADYAGEIHLVVTQNGCKEESDPFCLEIFPNCNLDEECVLEPVEVRLNQIDCRENDPQFDHQVFYAEGYFPLPDGYEICDDVTISYSVGTADWNYFRERNGRVIFRGFYFIPLDQLEEYLEDGFVMYVSVCDENSGEECELEVQFPPRTCHSNATSCDFGRVKQGCFKFQSGYRCFVEYSAQLYFVNGGDCDITSWTIRVYGVRNNQIIYLGAPITVNGTPIDSRVYYGTHYFLSEAEMLSFDNVYVSYYNNCTGSQDACVRTAEPPKEGSKRIQLSPNPGSNFVNVKSLDGKVIMDVHVISISGSANQEVSFISQSLSDWSINTSALSDGIYDIGVYFDDGSESHERFVVQ